MNQKSLSKNKPSIDVGGDWEKYRTTVWSRRRPPPIINEADKWAMIPTTRGFFTKVDIDDFLELSKYNWASVPSGKTKYRVVRYCGGKQMYMARMIMGSPKGLVVDHINGDPLDNRRCNLRVCTHVQNDFNRRLGSNNTSGYKGVVLEKNTNKWGARIKFNNKVFYMGFFKDKIDAALAYDKKAIELFGEYANLNFPTKLQMLKVKNSIPNK